MKELVVLIVCVVALNTSVIGTIVSGTKVMVQDAMDKAQGHRPAADFDAKFVGVGE